MKAEVGAVIRLTVPQGRKRVNENDEIEWDTSEEAGHLPAGLEGVVLAIVPPEVAGAGDNAREHVAIRFGPEEHGHPDQRHWSYPTEDMDKVFELVKAAPKASKETE